MVRRCCQERSPPGAPHPLPFPATTDSGTRSTRGFRDRAQRGSLASPPATRPASRRTVPHARSLPCHAPKRSRSASAVGQGCPPQSHRIAATDATAGARSVPPYAPDDPEGSPPYLSNQSVVSLLAAPGRKQASGEGEATLPRQAAPPTNGKAIPAEQWFPHASERWKVEPSFETVEAEPLPWSPPQGGPSFEAVEAAPPRLS